MKTYSPSFPSISDFPDFGSSTGLTSCKASNTPPSGFIYSGTNYVDVYYQGSSCRQGCANSYDGIYLRYFYNSDNATLVPNNVGCTNVASASKSYNFFSVDSWNDYIVYRPETEVYFTFMAIIAAFFLFFMVYRLILHPFWRKK